VTLRKTKPTLFSQSTIPSSTLFGKSFEAEKEENRLTENTTFSIGHHSLAEMALISMSAR